MIAWLLTNICLVILGAASMLAVFCWLVNRSLDMFRDAEDHLARDIAVEQFDRCRDSFETRVMFPRTGESRRAG